ncbi:hypothetical protein ACOSQ3_009184 [Xanthoceras sorbifolium]
MDLRSPKGIKDVQKLTGRLAALNCFIFKSSEKCKPFFELSEYDVNYQPRMAIKSQALADFIADFTPRTLQQAEEELCTMSCDSSKEVWTLAIDGSSNTRG